MIRLSLYNAKRVIWTSNCFMTHSPDTKIRKGLSSLKEKMKHRWIAHHFVPLFLKPSIYLTLHFSKFTKYLQNKIVQIYEYFSESSNLHAIALFLTLLIFRLLSVAPICLCRLPLPPPPPPFLLFTRLFLDGLLGLKKDYAVIQSFC